MDAVVPCCVLCGRARAADWHGLEQVCVCVFVCVYTLHNANVENRSNKSGGRIRRVIASACAARNGERPIDTQCDSNDIIYLTFCARVRTGAHVGHIGNAAVRVRECFVCSRRARVRYHQTASTAERLHYYAGQFLSLSITCIARTTCTRRTPTRPDTMNQAHHIFAARRFPAKSIASRAR